MSPGRSTRRAMLVAGALGALSLAGISCRKGAGHLGIHTRILFPAGEDLTGVDSVEVDVRQLPSATATSAVLVGMASFAPNDAWEIPDSGASTTRPLYVEVLGKTAGGAVVRAGRTRWIDPKQASTRTFGIFFAAPDASSSLPSNPAAARSRAGLVTLDDGRVVLAGGEDNNGNGLTSVEVYDPDAGTWTTLAQPLSTARRDPAIAALADGNVFLAGGVDDAGNELASAEVIVVPPLDTPASTPTPAAPATPAALQGPAYGMRAARLPSGKVVLGGGFSAAGDPPPPMVFDPATGAVTALAGGVAAAGAGVVALDGKVAIVGGRDATGPLATVQVVSENGGTVSLAPSDVLHVARAGASVLPVVLGDGSTRVFVAGGESAGGVSATVELLDLSASPPAASFAAEREREHRAWRAAVLLGDGRVFEAGGLDFNLAEDDVGEIWDPATQREEACATLPHTRAGHAQNLATTLPDGTALVGGGDDGRAMSIYVPPRATLAPPPGARVDLTVTPVAALRATGTVFDGATDLRLRFWDRSSLVEERHFAPGTTSLGWPSFLVDNEDLYATLDALSATGGVLAWGASAWTLTSADQAAGTLSLLIGRAGEFTQSPTAMQSAHGDGAAALLADGRVAVVGGADGATATDLYDPTDGTSVSLTGSTIPVGRTEVQSVVSGGILYVVGSVDDAGARTDASSLLDLGTAQWSAGSPLPSARTDHRVVALANGDLLSTGATNATGIPVRGSVRFDGNAWAATANPPTFKRARHTATLLSGGDVLVAAGISSGAGVVMTGSAELYDPAADAYTVTTGSLTTPRRDHSAIPFGTDQALLCGGRIAVMGNSNVTATCERFSGATQAFSDGGSLSVGRDDMTTVERGDGDWMFVGGTDAAGNALDSVDVFDPATGAIGAGPSLVTPRSMSPLVLLPDGRVIVAGGLDDAAAGIDTVELYTPPTWTNPFGY